MPRKPTGVRAIRSKKLAAVRKYKSKPYRKFRAAKNVSDWASLSEELTFTNALLNSNQMYVVRNIALDQFARASSVATSYQHYRIKKVTLRFKPQIDTFIGGSAYIVPNLYYMIDKSGSIPQNSTVAALKSMGAKPHRFDDKIITCSWRPSVLINTADSPVTSAIAQYKISPWLSTNQNTLSPGAFVPSNVDHLGIFWYLDNLGADVRYSVDIMVEFQFKKPLNNTLSSAENPAISVLDTLTIVH